MNKLILFVTTLFALVGFAQDQSNEVIMDSLDNKYREDQFYLGVTYNLLGNKPDGLAQNGFSTGIQLGYIRDFPINKRRNIAIGIGLGYSYNSINQNLQILESGQGQLSYQIVSNDMFRSNRLSLHLVELPIEFRWRTSTAKAFSFWRIYTGIKFGYVFVSKYSFKGDPEDITINNVQGINDLQYGLTFSAGYDKINVNFYYGLSSLFEDSAKLNNGNIDSNLVKIGLIIYIL